MSRQRHLHDTRPSSMSVIGRNEASSGRFLAVQHESEPMTDDHSVENNRPKPVSHSKKPSPLTADEKRALDLKTEAEARHQARVGRAVRG